MSKNGDNLRNILLFLAVVLAVSVMAVSFIQYRDARLELSSLQKDLNESTARWQQINEEKLSVQKDLKTARNSLREANLTIEESEERVSELQAEIAALEQEIEALKNRNP